MYVKAPALVLFLICRAGSDVMGRSTAFNATLFFTAVFGILASFANSFGSLCAILFFLGSSVGVSLRSVVPNLD